MMRLPRLPLGFTLALLAQLAAAQQHSAMPPVALSIGAQSMERALQTFARQSGLQVIFPTALAKDLMAPRIEGSYTPQAALDLLLRNSQLHYEFVNDRTVAIRPEKPQVETTSGAASLSVNGPAAEGGGLRIAQAEQPSPSHAEGKGEDKKSSSQEDDSSGTKGVPEILVLGKGLNTDIERKLDDPQPYRIIGRREIERSGATNLETLFKKLLTANTNSTSNDATINDEGHNNNINLRGLGANQTLITVNGRRIASGVGTAGSAFRQAGIKGIPLSAIERVEVLASTASGIYGGGATGGVINIVLRHDYSGADIELVYDNTFDSDSTRRSLNFSSGFNVDFLKTNVLMAGSYSDSNVLASGDRDFVSRGRRHLLKNDPNFFYGTTALPPNGASVNIRNVNGAQALTLDDGTSLNSPRTYVPIGYDGPASDGGQALRQFAGSYNLGSPDTFDGRRQALLSNPTLKTLNVSVRQKYTPWLRSFLDMNVSEDVFRLQNNPGVASFALPAANSPFQQEVRVTVPLTGTSLITIDNTQTNWRVTGGLIFNLGHDWSAETDFTYDQVKRHGFHSVSSLDSTRIRDAAIAGTLNVLRDPNEYRIDASGYTFEPNTYSPVTTTLRDSTLRASGPLFNLPAGPLVLSSLLEYRDEMLSEQQTSIPLSATNTLVQYSPRMSQSVKSAYAELRAPLFSSLNAFTGMKELELQLAGRHDDYSILGSKVFSISSGVPAEPIRNTPSEVSSTDVTFGVRYVPLRGLMLRASYGTGFLPPSVTQLLSNPASPNFSGTTLVDPLRGGTVIGGTILYTGGGNPDLAPEESESWSAGLVFTPLFVESLRVSIDYTHIEKEKNIQSFTAQQIINNEAYLPGRVIRQGSCTGPYTACPIIEVDGTTTNLARSEVGAYDLQADYQWTWDNLGNFQILLGATYQPKLQLQIQPTSPVVQIAGIREVSSNPVKLKANGSLIWNWRTVEAGWSATRFGSYLVADPSVVTNANSILRQGNGGRVPSQIYHDAFVSWSPSSQQHGWNWLNDMRIQLSIQNVLNAEPPVDITNSERLYSYLGSPRLRSYALSVQRHF